MRRDGGKGDRKRPLVISEKQFESNWDAIFNKPYEPLKDGQDQKVVSKEIADAIDKALGIER